MGGCRLLRSVSFQCTSLTLVVVLCLQEELYLEAEVPGLVKLTTEAVFGDVTVAVTKGAKLGKGSKGRHTASFPNAVTEALTASSTQYLHVMLSITSKSTGGKLSPHQVRRSRQRFYWV